MYATQTSRSLPHTEAIFPTLLTLPLHEDLENKDVEYICSKLKATHEDFCEWGIWNHSVRTLVSVIMNCFNEKSISVRQLIVYLPKRTRTGSWFSGTISQQTEVQRLLRATMIHAFTIFMLLNIPCYTKLEITRLNDQMESFGFSGRWWLVGIR